MFRMIRQNRQAQNRQDTPAKPKQSPAVSKNDWCKSIQKQQSPALKIHVYNFLITQGHFDIAQTFATQAQISPELLQKYKNNPHINQQATTNRLEVKSLIKNNQIDQAINKLKSFNLKDKDQEYQEQLIFSLLCLKTVHLIKQQNFQTAINKARNDLLPLANKKKDTRVPMLEKVMSLIAFVEIKQCQSSGLLDIKHVNSIAEQVNTYLLGKNSPQSLKSIINVGRWLERRLEDHMKFPHFNPWSSDLYQK